MLEKLRTFFLYEMKNTKLRCLDLKRKGILLKVLYKRICIKFSRKNKYFQRDSLIVLKLNEFLISRYLYTAYIQTGKKK